MTDEEKLLKIEKLKIEIKDSVGINDDKICACCDELIQLAKEADKQQSIAFGYVWRADYFFYVASDIEAVAKELDCAQIYIDEKNPSILLEKFYTLKHVMYEALFDMQSQFHYCLKALDISEKLNIGHRIGANFGNIGTYFFGVKCYEEALEYTEKALYAIRSLEEQRPRLMRILLSNYIIINLKIGRLEQVESIIEELSLLPVAKKDLKLYVDYGWMLYYSAIKNCRKSLYYLQEVFRDGLMDLPNKAYIIEMLSNASEAMLYLNVEKKTGELLSCMKAVIKEEETEPLLALCELRIQYSKLFETKDELQMHYRNYYELYSKLEKKNHHLKAEGMRARMELHDARSRYSNSETELKRLHEIANYDELTMVYNRYYMNIKLDEIINVKKYKTIGFILADVDYFKEYNDFYGHVAGDKVLRQVAECLKKNAGGRMAVFRYGGDEFVVLFWDMSIEEAETYIDQVSSALKAENIKHLHSLCAKQVTLSIGYGCQHITTRADGMILFEEVDKALYISKRKGRNSATLTAGKNTGGEYECAITTLS